MSSVQCFRRVSQIRQAINALKRKKTRVVGEQKLDLLPESDDQHVKPEWSITVFRNNLREQILSILRLLKRTDSWLLALKTGDVKDFQEAGSNEANHLFLWAAFQGRLDLMMYFKEKGADVSFCSEPDNYNALHLTALAGSVECCKWLLEVGCPYVQTLDDLTAMHYAALGNSKEVIMYLLKYYEIPKTIINSAVFANAVECVKFLLLLGADTNAYYDGMNALHLAADLHYIDCMKELLNEPSIDINSKTKQKGYTALHFAAENGYADCIELLLNKRARIDEINSRQQTALHLACKLNYCDCVEILLKNKASINNIDVDHKTPLHFAVSKSYHCLSVVEMLVRWEANVNAPDRYGYTPLHIAALNELEECATFLILNGANVTAETQTGLTALNIVSRKTPASVPAIEKWLTKSLAYTTTQSLKFSFRELVVHSKVGEIGYLYTLQKEGHKEILQHPLCRAILHLKWEKMKLYYFIRVVLVFIIVLLLSFVFIVDIIDGEEYSSSYRKNSVNNSTVNSTNSVINENSAVIGSSVINSTHNHSIENHGFHAILNIVESKCHVEKLTIITWGWSILIIAIIANIIRRLLSTVVYASKKDYFRNISNVAELMLMLSVFLIFIMRKPENKTDKLGKLVATYAILLAWTYLALIVGQLPFFGSYILMFTKVFKELLKLLTVYFCLLVGFAITFGAIKPERTRFGNPLIGIVRTLAMMTGEINFDGFTNIDEMKSPFHQVAAYSVLTMFIILMTMAMMNLLVGIAVKDVEGLEKTADITNLVHRTQLIYFLEKSLFHGYFPERLGNFIKKHFSPNLYPVVVYVRPLNPLEKRIPKKIMMEALEMAINKNNPVSEDTNDAIAKRIEILENKVIEMCNLLSKVLENKS